MAPELISTHEPGEYRPLTAIEAARIAHWREQYGDGRPLVNQHGEVVAWECRRDKPQEATR